MSKVESRKTEKKPKKKSRRAFFIGQAHKCAITGVSLKWVNSIRRTTFDVAFPVTAAFAKLMPVGLADCTVNAAKDNAIQSAKIPFDAQNVLVDIVPDKGFDPIRFERAELHLNMLVNSIGAEKFEAVARLSVPYTKKAVGYLGDVLDADVTMTLADVLSEQKDFVDDGKSKAAGE